MLIWKVLLQTLAVVLGLLVANLDYIWHDKRTLKFKRTRVALYVLSGVFLIISIVVTVQSERKADHESQELRVKLGELTNETQYARQEITGLRSMLEPFEKLAKAQYPNLNVQEALDQLSQRISKVQELATQDYYRSLAPDLRTVVLSNLKAVFDRLNTPIPHVRVIALQGDATRYQLAQEIAELLAEAGFKASSAPMQVIFSGIPPAVLVRYHAVDEEITIQILNALTSILQTQFGRAREEKWDSHYILITIAGDPLFSPSGQVTFR